MSDERTYSDEELTAFLDGEADEDLTRELSLAVARDPGLSARLERLSIDTSEVRQAFDTLLDDAPAAPDFLTAPATALTPVRRSVPMRAIAATAVFCLLAGAAAGYFIAGPGDRTWQDYAATYHALYVNSTLSTVAGNDSETEAQLKRVSTALGKPIELAAVSENAGLDYKRAQILGFEGRPLAQLAFLSKVGAPIALCIMRSYGAKTQDVRMGEMRGMSAATWSKGNFEYLLIGGEDKALIEQAARRLADRL